jgi:hypothetical protein
VNKRPAALLALALFWASIATPARAAPLDLHEQWDQRCKVCHGHAGDFARRWLTVEEGRLVGHHHRANLGAFLHNHYLADDLVEPMVQMLSAQATREPVFKSRCARCHGAAPEFARGSLEWRNGALYGRSSGQPVSDHLTRHGGLSAAEIAPMVDTLKRVRGEVAPAP